jgi:hypothetical protein
MPQFEEVVLTKFRAFYAFLRKFSAQRAKSGMAVPRVHRQAATKACGPVRLPIDARYFVTVSLQGARTGHSNSRPHALPSLLRDAG